MCVCVLLRHTARVDLRPGVQKLLRRAPLRFLSFVVRSCFARPTIRRSACAWDLVDHDSTTVRFFSVKSILIISML